MSDNAPTLYRLYNKKLQCYSLGIPKIGPSREQCMFAMPCLLELIRYWENYILVVCTQINKPTGRFIRDSRYNSV